MLLSYVDHVVSIHRLGGYFAQTPFFRFWDLRQPQPILGLDLPERVYCADVHYPLAIVGTANRQVIAYNLENGPTEFTRIESPLKFQVSLV